MLGMFTYYKVKNKMNQGECFPLFTLIESGRRHCLLSSHCESPEPDWSKSANQFCFILWWCHRQSWFAVAWPFTQWVTPGSFSDRRILHVVGVACVMGFTASFVQLPGSSIQQEIISSDFKSRSLLWTTDNSGIRVSLVWYLIRDQNEVLSPSSNVLFILPFRFSPPERSLVSPSALCPPCSTSAPDSPKYTLM